MSAAIEVSRVTKEYRLGALTSLRQGIGTLLARARNQPASATSPFKALDDVSFSVQPGEVVGLIGHNGAGKSTLLKLISRITRPTHGSVTVRGRIAPLIEVGAGFVGDFTGRENVFLNGAILGLKRKEIQRRFDEIVEFAEMEKFIDTPVKRYSSGMQVKLAFAVATSIESEILIVDEVLAVGDLAFQRKCFDRMERLIKEGNRAVLLVSHNIRQVERLCKRAILMDRGRVLADGESVAVCDQFYARSDSLMHERSAVGLGNTQSNPDVRVEAIGFINENGEPIQEVSSNERATIVFKFKLFRGLRNPTFGIGIHTPDLLYIATQNTESTFPIDRLDAGEHVLHCQIDTLPLLPGVYGLRAGITEGDAASTVFYGENLASFQIVKSKQEKFIMTSSRSGFVRVDMKWHFDRAIEKSPVGTP